MKSEKSHSFQKGFLVGIIVTIVVGSITYGVGKGVIWVRDLFEVPVSQTAEAGTVSNPATQAKIALIEDMIQASFLYDLDLTELENGIYEGMLDSLGDKYAEYFTAEEWQQYVEEMSGSYHGIGAYIMLDEETGYVTISKVIRGTPAEDAGLWAEDIIYEVDGVETYGMTSSRVVSLIRGPEDTTVEVGIVREGESEVLYYTITRKTIVTPIVEYEMLENQIAYIQIVGFDEMEATLQQFDAAMTQAKEDGMQGMILELRGNPGGYLDTVVAIAERILPQGLIVYTEDRNGYREEFTCAGKTPLEVPLVVLVDGGSASASEILAGAIQDYELGTIVGTTTYGKGVVQTMYPVGDGSYVKMTVSSYYTPLGNSLDGTGIAPDVVVEFDAESYREDGIDNQKEKAIEILLEKLATLEP